MEKPLETVGWAQKLGGAGPQRMTRVGQTVWARLTESQIWYPPTSSMALYVEGSEMEQWYLLALLSERKLSPSSHPEDRQPISSHMSLMPFNLLSLCWISEEVSLSKSVHRPFKRNYLLLQKFLYSTASMPTGFYSQKLWRHIPGTGTLGLGSWCGAGTPHSWDIPPNFYWPHVGVGPACSTSLHLLPVLMWFLLEFHSCSTSIQLDFWHLWMMVVLQFSCTFDVVLWEGKPYLPIPPSGLEFQASVLFINPQVIPIVQQNLSFAFLRPELYAQRFWCDCCTSECGHWGVF